MIKFKTLQTVQVIHVTDRIWKPTAYGEIGNKEKAAVITVGCIDWLPRQCLTFCFAARSNFGSRRPILKPTKTYGQKISNKKAISVTT